jgi:hypothetical protein
MPMQHVLPRKMTRPQQIDSVADSRHGPNTEGHHHVRLSTLGICVRIYRHTSADGGAVADRNVQDSVFTVGHKLTVHLDP